MKSILMFLMVGLSSFAAHADRYSMKCEYTNQSLGREEYLQIEIEDQLIVAMNRLEKSAAHRGQGSLIERLVPSRSGFLDSGGLMKYRYWSNDRRWVVEFSGIVGTNLQGRDYAILAIKFAYWLREQTGKPYDYISCVK